MNILITGGSSNIAEGIAKRRLSLGDKVIITCATEKNLEKTLASYQGKNLPVTGFVYNFADPDASIDAINTILNHQPIDALILNAFKRVTRIRKLHEMHYETIHDYIMHNLQGNIWLIHQLLPSMLENNFGRLVFISSISAISGTSRYGAYCAAKAAIESLFLNLAVDYSAHNILSNIVRVGIFKTERTRHFWKNAHYQEKMAQIIPQGCMGEPEQVAEALDPLLSPTAFMTGSVLTVSGGLPLLRSEGLLLS